MHAAFASRAAFGAAEESNEDFVVAGDGFALVLDGVTPLPGVEYGCAHGVRWLVRRLAGHLVASLADEAAEPLTETLFRAIVRTRADHGDSCDLTNQYSPATTVSIFRTAGARFDYLVLADSPLVFQFAGEAPEAVLGKPVPAASRRWPRGRDPGHPYRVAGIHPEAVENAVVGSRPLERLARVAVMSDGVSRLVERHGYSWQSLLDLVDAHGPAEAIECVRRADVASPPARGKPHDDASVVFLRFDTESGDTDGDTDTDTDGGAPG